MSKTFVVAQKTTEFQRRWCGGASLKLFFVYRLPFFETVRSLKHKHTDTYKVKEVGAVYVLTVSWVDFYLFLRIIQNLD